MLALLPDAESPILLGLSVLLASLCAAAVALLVWGVPQGLDLQFALQASRGTIILLSGAALLVAFAFAQGGAALSLPGRVMVLGLMLGTVASASVFPVARSAARARSVMGMIKGPGATVAVDAQGDVVVSYQSRETRVVLGRVVSLPGADRRVAVLSYEDAVRLTELMGRSEHQGIRRLAMADADAR